MSLEGINVGEYGTPIELTAKDKDGGEALSIDSYTSLSVKVTKPDGTSVTRTASFVTDGTDGKLKFTPQDGDFDQEGEYQFQALLGIGSSVLAKSLVEEFYVEFSL